MDWFEMTPSLNYFIYMHSLSSVFQMRNKTIQNKINKFFQIHSWVWVILAVSYPKDIHQQQNSWQISIKHDFFTLEYLQVLERQLCCFFVFRLNFLFFDLTLVFLLPVTTNNCHNQKLKIKSFLMKQINF